MKSKIFELNQKEIGVVSGAFAIDVANLITDLLLAGQLKKVQTQLIEHFCPAGVAYGVVCEQVVELSDYDVGWFFLVSGITRILSLVGGGDFIKVPKGMRPIFVAK
jgi:hypothetical protein